MSCDLGYLHGAIMEDVRIECVTGRERAMLFYILQLPLLFLAVLHLVVCRPQRMLRKDSAGFPAYPIGRFVDAIIAR